MNELQELLKEEYEKKVIITPQSLIEMIEEMMTTMPNPIVKEVATGARERSRVLRLPAIRATEISVGQRPNSEERAQFVLWMQNLGLGGGSDESAVAQKIKAITDFFENPEANLTEASMPQTLSYLMFLNQFVWMLKEFNAAVAGFLWEPFLASLFGGKSEQVPTSRHDIADIRIYTPDKPNAPISLKILNEIGNVKGSFTDLVRHFAGSGDAPPGDEMRYVIVVKDLTTKEKAVSAVTFYEFNITAANFFDWIGYAMHTQTIQVKDKTFKASRDLKEVWLRRVADRYEIRHGKAGVGKKGGPTGKVSQAWVPIAQFNKKKQVYYINPEGATIVDLRLADGAPAREGIFDPDANYTAAVAEFKAGGKKGATMQKGYEAIPGTETKTTKLLWGGADEMAEWSSLAQQLKQMGQPPSVFFKAVLGEDPGIPWPGQPALGARRGASAEGGGTQFVITPAHYKGRGTKLGTLRITTQAVEAFFVKAAETLNADLVTMFNALADLTDNIGRFFLVDCGGDEGADAKCTPKDEANRTAAGEAAINDAAVLEDAVTSSIGAGPKWTGQHE